MTSSVTNLAPPLSDDLVAQVVAVLSHQPAGLITDVDGTVSPIVERPEDARVLPGAQHALGRLSQQLALVGVVSGRAVADVRSMVGVDGITYVGNHGFELLEDGRARLVDEAVPWAQRLTALLEEIKGRLTGPGIEIENKGATATIHYRTASDQESARQRILATLDATPGVEPFRLEEGRKVINLLPPLQVTKGTSVRRLVRERHLRGLVYLGDDVTDTHAFEALADLRREESRVTLSIGVVGAETPPAIAELADVTVPSVEAVVALLGAVADALDGEAAS